MYVAHVRIPGACSGSIKVHDGGAWVLVFLYASNLPRFLSPRLPRLYLSINLTPQRTEGGTWGWVVNLIGSGAPDEEKCISSESVEDPTEITTTSWACELS